MKFVRATMAGVAGTAAMSALILVELVVHLPTIAIGQVLGSSLGLASALPSVGPALGWVLHFVIGALLALAYAGLLVTRLPGAPWLRGLIYGMVVFILAQSVFMPFVGGGFFSRGDPELLLGSLLGHLIYGGLVGWVYGPPPATA